MVRKPTEDELKLINSLYAKEEYSADQLRVIDIMGASAGVQTDYFSFLTPKSIQNFVMDVNGKMRSKKAPTIAYYVNHDRTSRLPLGALFDASEEGEEKGLEFHHKVFMPLGYSTGDITSDDYLTSVGLSMSEQVSVGFVAKKTTCRLCQQDIRSSKCSHWPGGRYNMGTEEEPKFEICTYDVDDARLLEESAAWRGALPGARILSVEGDDGKRVEQPVGIKHFAEGSTLKFNCAGVGTIELANDMDLEQFNMEGGVLMAKELIPEELNVSSSESGSSTEVPQDFIESFDILVEENDQLSARVLELMGEAADLRVEANGLREQLAATEASFGPIKATADAYVVEIREEIHKLAVGIDASVYNKETLDALLDKFSLDEQKNHRKELRVKLSKAISIGRKTSDEGGESKATLADYINKDVYKVGR